MYVCIGSYVCTYIQYVCMYVVYYVCVYFSRGRSRKEGLGKNLDSYTLAIINAKHVFIMDKEITHPHAKFV